MKFNYQEFLHPSLLSADAGTFVSGSLLSADAALLGKWPCFPKTASSLRSGVHRAPESLRAEPWPVFPERNSRRQGAKRDAPA